MNSISSFSVDVLLNSIGSNDQLVRRYHEKCAENVEIQQNLDSITETAQKIQQMYTNEKDQKIQLQNQNDELINKLNHIQTHLDKVENERVNTDTLNKQTIAELQEQIDQHNKKYFELCELFVEQANILHANSLSTAPLRRKCTAIKEILFSNGIHFEWNKSPAKQKGKSTNEKAKVKTTHTIGTSTDPIEYNSMPKKLTCEKSTQYQQSKTTRSTCTSAFIHTIDAFTNTEANSSSTIETIACKVVSHPKPLPLPPIDDIDPTKVSNSTQTDGSHRRTQGTLTEINNVRKRVNYVRTRTKSNAVCEVKKEEYPAPCASVPNVFNASPSDVTHLTAQFYNMWQMLGDIFFRIAGQSSTQADEKLTNDIRIIQKFNEIQSLIGEKTFYSKATEKLYSDETMRNFDCQDEHSRDSIESYNSANVVISNPRNLENCSPLLEENSICSTSINRQTSFKPITPISSISPAEGRDFENERESAIACKPPSPLPLPLPSSSPNDAASPRINQTKDKSQGENPPKWPLCMGSSSSSNLSEHQTDADVHFKVPKRKFSTKTTTTASHTTTKKRKTTEVSRINNKMVFQKTNMIFNLQIKSQKPDVYTSLFGEISDDEDIEEDQIQRIFDLFVTPKMLSPIKDWPDDAKTQPPPLHKINLDETTISTTENMQQSDAVINEEHSDDSAVLLPPLNHLVHEPIENPLEFMPQITDIEAEVEQIHDDQLLNSNQQCGTSNDLSLNINCDYGTQISLNCENNTDEMVDVDYNSPASPIPEDQLPTVEPPIIPISPVRNTSVQKDDVFEASYGSTDSDSAIDQIIYNYLPNVRNEVLSCTLPFTAAECYLLASLRNAIEKYCLMKEWTAETATECISKLLVLSRQPRHLAASILEVVEDTKENLCIEYTPPAPALQASHQKCLILVHRLTQFIPSFNKYLHFELERKLFTFGKEKSVVAMTNLAHFFVALVDTDHPTDRSKVRLFIFKCLYYYKTTAVPLVFTVIMAHPYALPHANSVEFITDPLTRAIISTLSNIIYSEPGIKETNLKKTEMFHTLKRRYGFFMDKLFPIDSVIEYCVNCMRANRLKHIGYALILIAKRQDVEYAVKEILKKHLIPMLHHYCSMDLNVNAEHDEKICTILFTIGSIVKTFPIEQNIQGFLDIFSTCLNVTQRQVIQEAAVSAICQMNRFGVTRIYQHLANWKPTYEISPHIHAMLKTIAYRKPKQFWYGYRKSKGFEQSK